MTPPHGSGPRTYTEGLAEDLHDHWSQLRWYTHIVNGCGKRRHGGSSDRSAPLSTRPQLRLHGRCASLEGTIARRIALCFAPNEDSESPCRQPWTDS